MDKKMNIGIVENEASFRDSITSILKDFADLIVWKSAEECYRDERLQEINFLVLDIGLPHMNGIDFLKLIRPKFPNIKILILSGINSDEMIFDALKFGANGYIWKKEIKNLKESIEVLQQDGSFMSSSIGVRVLHYFRSKVKTDSSEDLSSREKQVLELVINGLKIIEISDQLGIAVSTTKKHISNIYEKLQVTNRVGLVKKANELGYF
jgi:DNA-binding NarL/FixJ family response regulator